MLIYQEQRPLRVAIADFWRIFHHDGKIIPGWRGGGGGGGCTPTPFHSITIKNKVAVYALAERAGTLTLLHLYPICTLWQELWISACTPLTDWAWWEPQTREYIDWRWPLSCVHSVMMMVFLAQLTEGGGHAHSPLLVYPLHSSYVTPSPARLARYCYTHCPSHLQSGVNILIA
jgi:hypothetical protein